MRRNRRDEIEEVRAGRLGSGDAFSDFASRLRGAVVRSPSPDVSERHLAAMLCEVGRQESRGALRRGHGRARRFVAVVATSALFVVAGGSVAFASDGAVPGDPLYGVDRAVERLQILMARSSEAKANAYLAQATERLGEIDALRARGRRNLIRGAAGDLARAEAGALAASGTARGRDAEALRAFVLERIGMHVTRLETVLTRLRQDGHANERALTAIQRAIDNAAKASGKVQHGRPAEPPTPTATPSSAPGNSGSHRRDGTPPGRSMSGR